MSEPTVEQQTLLTRFIIDLLDGWGVDAADQVAILDLPSGTRTRAIRKYREDTPLPQDKGVMCRVEHLVAIAEALRTMYPMNPSMGARWMNQPHRRFRKRTPIATMLEDGASGVVAVRSELDCTYAWDMTGSRGGRTGPT